MFSVEVKANVSGVNVHTTKNRGFTPEEISGRAVEKILFISNNADPLVQAQAEAFRDRIYHVIVAACKDAINSDRTTMCNIFSKQGHNDMADILRSL